MRFQTNIFVAPWPQDEAMKLYGCFSLTSTWGCKQIILLLRDLNIRSRGNTFIAPWPQNEVTRKYFPFSVTSTWGRKQILFNLCDQNLWSRTNNFPPHVLQIYRGFFCVFMINISQIYEGFCNWFPCGLVIILCQHSLCQVNKFSSTVELEKTHMVPAWPLREWRVPLGLSLS